MRKTRLLDKPEDYKKIGVSKDRIEPWEDGRRDNTRPGAFEWWYFDAIMEDGTKAVIVFAPKPIESIAHDGDLPFVRLELTLPDGTHHSARFDYTAEDGNFKKEGCDIKIGPHTLTGNLKEYSIKFHPVKGIGADLKLTSLGRPWRPGAGYFSFGDQEEQYFTWLCCVPKGAITGTVTVNGESRAVQGFGYHDHQWGNIHHVMAWNHWIWARHNVGDYNILIFDLVTSRDFGFKGYPLCFIEDKEGSIIFENTENVKFEVIEEYLQEQTKKYYPKRVKYTFENNGKTVEYTLSVKSEIEITDMYSASPEEVRKRFDMLGIQPTYTRYEGLGELVISEGNQTIKRSGNLIYEMVYCGKVYRDLGNG